MPALCHLQRQQHSPVRTGRISPHLAWHAQAHAWLGSKGSVQPVSVCTDKGTDSAPELSVLLQGLGLGSCLSAPINFLPALTVLSSTQDQIKVTMLREFNERMSQPGSYCSRKEQQQWPFAPVRTHETPTYPTLPADRSAQVRSLGRGPGLQSRWSLYQNINALTCITFHKH